MNQYAYDRIPNRKKFMRTSCLTESSGSGDRQDSDSSESGKLKKNWQIKTYFNILFVD